MYTMKQVCEKTGMTYEGLKFYCNEGLVPHLQRDAGNRRLFDDAALRWVVGLTCLRRCGMSIAEMREYVQLCTEGDGTIPQRKEILAQKRLELLAKMDELQKSVDYIDWKQRYYDNLLSEKSADAG